MPAYVVRQPNGLLAEFSTIVDAFTVMDATEEEMLIHWKAKIGVLEGAAKVRRGIDDDMTGLGEVTAADGLNRWRDAIETIRLIHGDGKAAEAEKRGSAKVEERT